MNEWMNDCSIMNDWWITVPLSLLLILWFADLSFYQCSLRCYLYVIIVSRISIISTTSLQPKVSCCVFMLSIIGSIWRCRFAMNGRKIYKTLKTHMKTHPVALLLNLFFFFIVSKPPSPTPPSWVPKVPSRFMLPAKNANVLFCLRNT